MKKAIIVGASSGIGREVACRLIRDGWQVGLMARREQPLVSLRDMADERVVYSLCDVTVSDASRRLIALIDRLGGVDLYFHAAGIGSQNLDLESQIELNTVNTNVVGFCRLVNVAFQYMKAHGGGHIAVISSIAGVKGLAPAPSYSATKAFQNTYIQALEQLAYSQRLPIRFTDVRPGFVDTALIAGSNFPLKMKPDMVARHIVNSIYRRRHVVIIDWRYRLLVFFWRLVPNCLWRHLPLGHRY